MKRLIVIMWPTLDTWQRNAQVDVIEVDDADVDAGQSNADGTGDAGRLHGVSRADAACLSDPRQFGQRRSECVCYASSTPDVAITR